MTGSFRPRALWSLKQPQVYRGRGSRRSHQIRAQRLQRFILGQSHWRGVEGPRERFLCHATLGSSLDAALVRLLRCCINTTSLASLILRLKPRIGLLPAGKIALDISHNLYNILLIWRLSLISTLRSLLWPTRPAGRFLRVSPKERRPSWSWPSRSR